MRFKVKHEPYVEPREGDIYTNTFFTFNTRIKDEVRMFERVTVEYRLVLRWIHNGAGKAYQDLREEMVRFIDKED